MTAMGKSTSIFNYSDYRNFLNDYFEEAKSTKPYFSHRYFCNQAGFKSPSVIKLVIGNKRNLSRTSIIKISRTIGFTGKEHDYFETLVLYNQAKRPDEKRDHLFKLAELKGLNAPSLVDHSQHAIYAAWYHPILRECLGIPDLPHAPEALSKKIWPRVDPQQIRDSIDLLEKNNLIRKNPDGSYALTDETITTEDELDSEFVAHFNREMLRIALRASVIFPRQEREISGVTLRISKAGFKEVKKRIAAFKKELLFLALKDEPADSIYQINFQAFPLLSDDRGT